MIVCLNNQDLLFFSNSSPGLFSDIKNNAYGSNKLKYEISYKLSEKTEPFTPLVIIKLN